MDEIEQAIRDEVDRVAAEEEHTQWNDGEWTRRLTGALVLLGRARGYCTCASSPHAIDWEWLFDVTWTDEPAGFLRACPLALEMEWNFRDLDRDFQKLVVARAEHRVFIFNYPPNQDRIAVLERLLHNVRIFAGSRDTDRYLFGGWVENQFQWHLALGHEIQAISSRSPTLAAIRAPTPPPPSRAV